MKNNINFVLNWDSMVTRPYYEVQTIISKEKGDITIDLSNRLTTEEIKNLELEKEIGYISYDNSTDNLIVCHRFYPFDEFPEKDFPLLGKGIADLIEYKLIHNLVNIFGEEINYKNFRLRNDGHRIRQYSRLNLDANQTYKLGEIAQKITEGFQQIYGYIPSKN